MKLIRKISVVIGKGLLSWFLVAAIVLAVGIPLSYLMNYLKIY